MRLSRHLKRFAGLAFVLPRRLAAAHGLLVGATFLTSALALAASQVWLALALFALTVLMTLVARATMRHLAQQGQEVAAAEAATEALRREIITDPVTGLANRAGLEEALADMAAARPLGAKIAMLWLDLKRFADVNDALGHDRGDKMLQEAAARLRETVPDDAALARLTCDQFVIAAPVPTRLAARELAERVAARMAEPLRVSGHRVGSGVAIGAAVMPDDADSEKRLLLAADMALYHSRRAPGDVLRFYEESMNRALARRKEIEADLRTAIQRDELSLYFQPIIDLRTGRIRTFEALVRWFHPEQGELLPGEFIPVAEESGLIVALGNWVVAQAAKAAGAWPREVTLAINLSPRQIRAPGAATGILAALRAARLDPSRLELEVTESLFAGENGAAGDENALDVMADLAAEGVGFALDDFGSGCSSLRYIHLYPFRTIKVDRSFVSGADTGQRSDAVIRAVAEMGASLHMQIVAEGLETLEQVEACRAAGCTLGQGYYFSRAVPDYQTAMLLAQEREHAAANPMVRHPRLAG